MTTYTLDAHETVQQFVVAGIPDKQAGVIVAAISRTDSEIVTKADLAAAVAGLKADILKAAIGVAVGVVIANASLTLSFLKGL